VVRGASAHGILNPSSLSQASAVFRDGVAAARTAIARDEKERLRRWRRRSLREYHEQRQLGSDRQPYSEDDDVSATPQPTISADLDFVCVMLGEVDVRFVSAVRRRTKGVSMREQLEVSADRLLAWVQEFLVNELGFEMRQVILLGAAFAMPAHYRPELFVEGALGDNLSLAAANIAGGDLTVDTAPDTVEERTTSRRQGLAHATFAFNERLRERCQLAGCAVASPSDDLVDFGEATNGGLGGGHVHPFFYSEPREMHGSVRSYFFWHRAIKEAGGSHLHWCDEAVEVRSGERQQHLDYSGGGASDAVEASAAAATVKAVTAALAARALSTGASVEATAATLARASTAFAGAVRLKTAAREAAVEHLLGHQGPSHLKSTAMVCGASVGQVTVKIHSSLDDSAGGSGVPLFIAASGYATFSKLVEVVAPQLPPICAQRAHSFSDGWNVTTCTGDLLRQLERNIALECGRVRGGPTFAEEHARRRERLSQGWRPEKFEATEAEPASSLMLAAPARGATIVTAYFPIPSKHSGASYAAWMSNFLSLQDPMVIFTSPEYAPVARGLRASQATADLHTEVIAIDLATEGLAASLLDEAGWQAQRERDPEKALHPDARLYWIWLEKANWLKRAADLDPFGTPFFAWVDIGFFRTQRFNGEVLLRELPSFLGPNQVLLLNVSSLVDGAAYCGGGFIGAYASGVRRWHTRFYETLGAHKHSDFIGKDQPWMMRACLETPGLCALAAPTDGFGDPWFFMAPLVHGDVSGIV